MIRRSSEESLHLFLISQLPEPLGWDAPDGLVRALPFTIHDRIDTPRSGHHAEALLFLDVDGVLNPLLSAGEAVPPGFAEHRLAGLRVLLSPQHGEWLNLLGWHYELVWATTWEADANQHLGPILRLTDLPYLEFPPPPRWNEDWTNKLPQVVAYAGDRPLAWVDDRFDTDCVAWQEERTTAGIPTLLVMTDHAIGLTREHVEELQRFASSIGGG